MRGFCRVAALCAFTGAFVSIAETRASMQELERTLPGYLRGKREVYVRGDARTPHGRVVEVLGRLKSLNLTEVTLMVDPEDAR